MKKSVNYCSSGFSALKSINSFFLVGVCSLSLIFSCSRSKQTDKFHYNAINESTEGILKTHLERVKADSGRVVVMEVKSGTILSDIFLVHRINSYVRNINSGLDQKREPGNLFAPIAMLGILDSGKLLLSDSVDTQRGLYISSGIKIFDSNYEHGGFGKITYEDALTRSSNIGVVRAMEKAFGDSAYLLKNQLEKMYYGDPFFNDSELKIPNWKFVPLGYELKISPKQMMLLYNSIANNGKMVDNGKVLNPLIASSESINAIQAALISVVEKGTGKLAQSDSVAVAGKTGSVHFWDGSPDSPISEIYYCASFCGYFPSDKPKYTCLVMVYNSKDELSYGGRVAAPIFKSIAEKIMRKEKR